MKIAREKKSAIKFAVDENGVLTNITFKSKSKPSDTLLEYLGKTNEEVLRNNDEEIKKKDDQISVLEKQLSDIKNKNYYLNKENKKLIQKKIMNYDEVKNKEKRIDDLQKKLGKATTPEERKKLEKEIKNLNNEMTQMKNKLRINEERIAKLRTQINEEDNPEERERLYQRILENLKKKEKELENETKRFGVECL